MNHWYEQELLRHYRASAFKGQLQSPTWTSDSFNPSCGDSIRFASIMNNDHLEVVRFEGAGCVISQATASLLAEKVQGQTLATLVELKEEDVLDLVKIPVGPTRSRCVLLSFEALKQGLSTYARSRQNAPTVANRN